MKKIFMSPLFVPAAFLILWLSFMGTVYYGFPENVLKVTVEGELIENITHIGYVLLIGMLLVMITRTGLEHGVFFCFWQFVLCCVRKGYSTICPERIRLRLNRDFFLIRIIR